MVAKRNPCRCGECGPCVAYKKHPERFLPEGVELNAADAKTMSDKAAKEFDLVIEKMMKTTAPTLTPTKKPLPTRIAVCKDLGGCSRSGCGEQRKHCLAGNGEVRHLEECQTCEKYVKKSVTPKKDSKKSQNVDSGTTTKDTTKITP